MWVNAVNAGENNLGRIFDKGTLLWFCNHVDLAYGISVIIDNTPGNQTLSSANAIVLGTAQAFAVTHGANATAPRLWRGSLSIAMAELGYAFSRTATMSDNSGSALSIGNRASDTARTWSGTIEHLSLWDEVLSLAQLDALRLRPYAPLHRFATAAGVLINLKGYWPLTESAAATCLDHSGNGNNGTVTGTTVGASAPYLWLRRGATWVVRPAGAAAAALEGAAALAVTTAAALTTGIPLVGASSLALATAAALTTGIPLLGSGTLTLASAGDLSTGIPLTGSVSLVLTTASDLSTAIPLSGTAALTLTSTGAIVTGIPLSGAASLVLTASGELAGGAAALAGTATLALTLTGDLATGIPLAATASLVLTTAAGLTTAIPLAGTASLVLTTTADLTGGLVTVGQIFLYLARQHTFAMPTRTREFRMAARPRIFALADRP